MSGEDPLPQEGRRRIRVPLAVHISHSGPVGGRIVSPASAVEPPHRPAVQSLAIAHDEVAPHGRCRPTSGIYAPTDAAAWYASLAPRPSRFFIALSSL